MARWFSRLGETSMELRVAGVAGTAADEEHPDGDTDGSHQCQTIADHEDPGQALPLSPSQVLERDVPGRRVRARIPRPHLERIQLLVGTGTDRGRGSRAVGRLPTLERPGRFPQAGKCTAGTGNAI